MNHSAKTNKNTYHWEAHIDNDVTQTDVQFY